MKEFKKIKYLLIKYYDSDPSKIMSVDGYESLTVIKEYLERGGISNRKVVKVTIEEEIGIELIFKA